MVSGLLNGLCHLHARQLAHANLSPANICVKDDIPTIVDFHDAIVCHLITRGEFFSEQKLIFHKERLALRTVCEVISSDVCIPERILPSLGSPLRGCIGAFIVLESRPSCRDMRRFESFAGCTGGVAR